ncbi:hypothetical protein FBG48_18420, partial [Escherichia coli]|nr:hypothetical protein [Escherichia coli]
IARIKKRYLTNFYAYLLYVIKPNRHKISEIIFKKRLKTADNFAARSHCGSDCVLERNYQWRK